MGIQEKATFLQAYQEAQVFGGAMQVPAVLQLFLALVGMAVLYHHAAPAAPAPKLDAETAEAVPRQEVEAEPLWSSGHRS